MPSRTDRPVFKIGCIANFNDLKDHMTLIKAVELLVKHEPDLSLIVSFVGSGPTLVSCRDYISRHQLNRYFEFVSEMAHESLPSYFNTLNLFVLPSYFEGFGCVYTEAAACGVPFIGCVSQGYSEYIPDDDSDKWLIKPHDYKALALLIDRQIKSPAAQTLKHTYDINILVRYYLSYLAEQLNS
ncbi:glycosyltransferase [Bacteroides acidifaciens]|uniref:glycosyltransferase n=2 Tax=Bacteroidales TaxID=171549 RepID=UPI002626E9BE|nr:glycosyltransferase [uncultured Duncaniella sp.]